MSTRLIELVERLGNPSVALVGDFMIDRYVFGRVDRVSPEAPIPVLRHTHEEQRLGGAGFVLAALATLGAPTLAIGVCGDDAAGEAMRRCFEQLHCQTTGLIAIPGRPTSTKLRLLGASEDRTPQQMMRLDIENPSPIDAGAAEKVFSQAAAAIDRCDLLLLEDYDKGVLTPDLCQRLIRLAKGAGKAVLVDPARVKDYGKYAGATGLKLNRAEAERATGLPVHTAEECHIAARKLIEQLALEAVVVTLNDQGCYVALADGTGQMLASRPRQVADATGAGDMVLAALCMARAAGADWVDAAMLANVVGGLEVEKVGCVPITREEIIRDLLAEHHEHTGKTLPLEALLKELSHHRAMGKKIVFTNGCFDLIHLGHVRYFQFARAQGDLLVVAVNTDESIRRLKGDKRPIITESDRLGVLEELQSIDYLAPFGEDTPIELIRAIRPDVIVKGADYTKDAVVGADFVEAYGGRVALAPLVPGRSTSSVIARISQAFV